VKGLIAIAALSTALAIGTTACAHEQMSRHKKETVISLAVIAGVVAAAVLLPCTECQSALDNGIQANALPPK
jgi:hypothetical protein